MRELTTAMLEKYDSETEQFNFIHCKTFGSNDASAGKARLRLPSVLTLDNEQISTVGDVSVVEELLKGIKELDLTKNLITDWKEVITLLEHMEYLEFMNLTMNPLDDSTLDDNLTCKFQLKTLVLNGTGISWPTLARLLTCFPNLAELHISLNGYKTVDLPPDFKCPSGLLQKLYMNNSEISDWGEITKLGRCFPRVQSFNMISSNLEAIGEYVKPQPFRSLMMLNISQSKLKSWDEIDRLRQFVCLDQLRITEVPFLDQFEDQERRQHLIARLPTLEMLNGSPVTETERDTAERAFIRYFMEKEDRPLIYDQLVDKHGELDKLAEVDFSAPDTESNNDVINLLVKFDDKMEYMDISLNQTVSEFKKMLQNFTGVSQINTIVYFVELFEGVVMHVNHLRLGSRKLFTYKMKKGDQIMIERKSQK